MTNDKTVTISRELAERMRQRLIDLGQIGDFGPELFQVLNCAAPVVERQEPVARFNIYASTHHTTSWGEPCVVAELHVKKDIDGEWARFRDMPPIQTRTVLLPDRLSWSGIASWKQRAEITAWNACLDKVKELNQ